MICPCCVLLPRVIYSFPFLCRPSRITHPSIFEMYLSVCQSVTPPSQNYLNLFLDLDFEFKIPNYYHYYYRYEDDEHAVGLIASLNTILLHLRHYRYPKSNLNLCLEVQI